MPTYTPQTSSNYQYTPYSTYEQQTKQYDTPQYGKTNQYNANATPKPFTSDTSYEKSYDYSTSSSNQYGGTDRSRYDNIPSSGSYTKFNTSSSAFEPPKYDFKTTGDGYTTKEYTTSTYKIPGGTQTDTYKYETYHSTSDPVYSSTTEKYYTSTPNSKFTPIDRAAPFSSNGSAFSSNVEYITETPVLKDSDSLEQKMLKKSITQQVIEKKTVQTTRSTKQESSTKNFRFD